MMAYFTIIITASTCYCARIVRLPMVVAIIVRAILVGIMTTIIVKAILVGIMTTATGYSQ